MHGLRRSGRQAGPVSERHFLKAMLSASGVGFAAQLIGFVRQVQTAAYFGIGRDLDIYYMAFAIATLLVFTFSMIFDTVSIPHLVRTLEEEGPGPFRSLTGSVFSFSLWASSGLSVLFLALTPLLSHIMAAGFSPEERARVWSLAWYFLPWTLISLPYYALCSFFKSTRQFTPVFIGEVIIAAGSVASLFLYHPGPRALPLAYFAGYLVAFTFLLARSFGRFDLRGPLATETMKKLYRNLLELFGANQVGSLSSVIERFFQSFIPAGGISALAYSQQISMAGSSLLSFREIFIVPLSSTERRAEKLERLVIGLTVITIPCMLYAAFFSNEIVTVLFQRGRFDAGAAGITAQTFSLYALGLLPGVAGVPVFRMFQVIDRIRMTAAVYLLAAANFAVFGWLFVFVAQMGTQGMALTVAINSYLSAIFSLYLLARCGIRPNYRRIIAYAGYSLLISLAAAAILRMATFGAAGPLIRLLASGTLFVVLVVLGHLPIKNRLLRVVYHG